MKSNNLKEIIEFFELKEGWDLREIIEDTVGATNLLRHETMGVNTLSMDECSIEWGDDYVCLLEDFVNKYTELFLKGVVNVIKSYDDELTPIMDEIKEV